MDIYKRQTKYWLNGSEIKPVNCICSLILTYFIEVIYTTYCVKAELSTKRPRLNMAVQKRCGCMMPDTAVRRKNSWWAMLACTQH